MHISLSRKLAGRSSRDSRMAPLSGQIPDDVKNPAMAVIQITAKIAVMSIVRSSPQPEPHTEQQ